MRSDYCNDEEDGVTNLSLKDFHMPMNSTREQINEVIGKFKSANECYTVGIIYMKTRNLLIRHLNTLRWQEDLR